MKFITAEPEKKTEETLVSEDGKWKLVKKHGFFTDMYEGRAKSTPLFSIMSEPFLVISIMGSDRTLKGAMRECINKMREARVKFADAIQQLEAAVKEEEQEQEQEVSK